MQSYIFFSNQGQNYLFNKMVRIDLVRLECNLILIKYQPSIIDFPVSKGNHGVTQDIEKHGKIR